MEEKVWWILQRDFRPSAQVQLAPDLGVLLAAETVPPQLGLEPLVWDRIL